MVKKRNKVIPLNRKENNYVDMLMVFLGKYRERFPSNYTSFDIVEFLIFVWNTHKMKDYVPVEKYDEMYNIIARDGADMKLIKEINDYCDKKYASYDRFIIDYDYDRDDYDFKLSVETGGIEEYFRKIEGMHADDLDGFEEDIIDRNAIILGYRKKFYDWAEKIDSDYEDLLEEPRIFLIDDLEDCDDWLRVNFDRIFIKELMLVTEDSELWPRNRTLTLFKQWFKISFSYEIVDLGLEDDFYDDDF